MNNTPKIAGQPCEFCQAKLVKSPKSGKIFCSDKCWLKPKPQGHPTQDKQDDVIQVPEQGVDWDEVRRKNSEGPNHGAARNNAVDLVIKMLELGILKDDPSIERAIELWTMRIEKI